MSHADGTDDGLNREKVRWYVGAYLKALVDCRANSATFSGDNDFTLAVWAPEVVERRYANSACSSANILCNSCAIKVARGEPVDDGGGIWFAA